MKRYTEDQILENNNLISQFMGFPYHKGSYLHPLFEEEDDWCPDVELIYHKSWDWLIPVVKKMHSMKGKDDNLTEQIKIVCQAVDLFEIHILYWAVVDFINEYTKNNK